MNKLRLVAPTNVLDAASRVTTALSGRHWSRFGTLQS